MAQRKPTPPPPPAAAAQPAGVKRRQMGAPPAAAGAPAATPKDIDLRHMEELVMSGGATIQQYAQWLGQQGYPPQAVQPLVSLMQNKLQAHSSQTAIKEGKSA